MMYMMSSLLFLNLKKSGWFLKQIHLAGFVVTPWLTNKYEGELRALKSIQTRIMPIVVGNSLQLVILWQLESRKKKHVPSSECSYLHTE